MSPRGLRSDDNVLPGQFGAVGTTMEPLIKYKYIKSVIYRHYYPDAELIQKCINLKLLCKYVDIEKLIRDLKIIESGSQLTLCKDPEVAQFGSGVNKKVFSGSFFPPRHVPSGAP